MFLIYGNYHWSKKDVVAQRGHCSICGSDNRPLLSYTAREVGHVYWIPLMPWGRRRIVQRCLTCGQCYIFSTRGKKLEGQIQRQRQRALEGVGNDVNATIADVSTLAHLGDFEGADQVIDRRAPRSEGEAALVRGWLAGLRGQEQEAREQFETALATMEDEACVRYWMSRFLFQQKHDEEAREHLDRAAELDAQYDDLPLLEALIKARAQKKEWEGLAVIMNAVASRDPQRAGQRRFARLHTKACSKSGRAPEGAWPHAQLEAGP